MWVHIQLQRTFCWGETPPLMHSVLLAQLNCHPFISRGFLKIKSKEMNIKIKKRSPAEKAMSFISEAAKQSQVSIDQVIICSLRCCGDGLHLPGRGYRLAAFDIVNSSLGSSADTQICLRLLSHFWTQGGKQDLGFNHCLIKYTN